MDRERYRDYVESGNGEELDNPFQRALAGLVLGREEYVIRVRKMLKDRPDPGEQPALREIRRGGKAAPEEVEAAVAAIFPGAHPARRRRLLLYAQRRHSNLRTMEIPRRYGRTHGAVFLAVRDSIPVGAVPPGCKNPQKLDGSAISSYLRRMFSSQRHRRTPHPDPIRSRRSPNRVEMGCFFPVPPNTWTGLTGGRKASSFSHPLRWLKPVKLNLARRVTPQKL